MNFEMPGGSGLILWKNLAASHLPEHRCFRRLTYHSCVAKKNKRLVFEPPQRP